ncbi:hypothetical protein ABF87_07890 [Nitrosomonas sp. JL21]|uniref:hypothetical protein n=1 Tax=Nitrosomonas sp. JL21 TaxID=153949 RepID=UPI001371D704|nr:hypothetical protein [Nitrosomonas sp. JL21]MBL8496313.1 hypothetical protein [Nitrosomonas sp.]MXS77884.1 hypothetical protein [Nitrosomonas sp. JL21]
MNDDEQRKIIIDRVSEFHRAGEDERPHVPISPLNRWATYLMLIPIVVAMVLIGMFFFAAFLALLAVAVVVIGIRFWWVRRQYEKARQQADDTNPPKEGDASIIIEDAQIIEETNTYRNKSQK